VIHVVAAIIATGAASATSSTRVLVNLIQNPRRKSGCHCRRYQR
jgi:hypothetical protein